MPQVPDVQFANTSETESRRFKIRPSLNCVKSKFSMNLAVALLLYLVLLPAIPSAEADQLDSFIAELEQFSISERRIASDPIVSTEYRPDHRIDQISQERKRQTLDVALIVWRTESNPNEERRLARRNDREFPSIPFLSFLFP